MTTQTPGHMTEATWSEDQERDWQCLERAVEAAQAASDTAWPLALDAQARYDRALSRCCRTRKPEDYVTCNEVEAEMQRLNADAVRKGDRTRRLVARQIRLAEPRYIAVYCGGKL